MNRRQLGWLLLSLIGVAVATYSILLSIQRNQTDWIIPNVLTLIIWLAIIILTITERETP